jgi:electron transfer flavoprotein beta subunit
MPYRSVVLVKQVPDTHNISGDVMTPEGTINRAALPTIFNPEDLNALEMALRVKDLHGGEVIVLTMGPMTAAEVLRESLYRGADKVFLLSDRRFAGADTLATSYALSCAIRKLGEVDLVFAGRQAIDGDTAQVGPQTAEKLGIPQITYAEAIEKLEGRQIVVRRALDQGTEMVRCSLPCLLTVVDTANEPRPASVRRRIANKLAATPAEYKALLARYPSFGTEEALEAHLTERGLKIPVWTAADVGAEESRLGLAGSPTQVYKINYVVLESSDSKVVEPTPEGIKAMIAELMQEYVVG